MRRERKRHLRGEGLAWMGGLLIIVGAALWKFDINNFNAELLMVVATYVLGLHWIVAYVFDGIMYGVVSLRPHHKLMRIIIFALGIMLVLLTLWAVLGLGGPFALA